jgi:hypothetical protein
MSNNLEKIYNSAKYARENGINPADPGTSDDNYRKRQMELAGVISVIETEIQEIKEGIEKANFNENKYESRN